MSHRPLRQILLVDDDPDLLAVVSLALTALGGYQVLTCSSAEGALSVAGGADADLIMLDIMMPGLDGFAVLAAMREMPATRATPVVFMSAHQLERRDLARYEGLGCLGVIPKPFDPATLPDRLEAFWQLHGRRKRENHQREFESLRRAYIGELGEKVAAMQLAAAGLVTQGWDRPVLESLRHTAHRIAGSAGLYRLAALSRSAQALEDIVSRLLAAPSWPPSSSPVDLARLVKAVEQTVRGEVEISSAPPAAAREPWSRDPAATSRPR